MSRRESIGRLKARTQSSSGPAVQDMVSVAVLPPRLSPGLAPPTGIAAADTISFDERINWQHNEKIDRDESVSKKKQFFRKAGLTTQRQKANPDLPPFVLRQIPYETWRKHYAKDKDGNYHGTHAPAEDCLLKPGDVEKWRLGDPVTKADLWTRGREALPVYAEVNTTAAVPEHEYDYDRPPRTEPSLPEGEDYLDPDDDRLVSHHEARTPSLASQPPRPPRSHSYSGSQTASIPEEPQQRQIIADGKTAEEIIANAKAKGKPKTTWKQMLSKGVQMASFGA